VLTHAAFKATEATAPEATEAATPTASGIAGTPSRVSSSAPDPPPLKWSDLRYVFDIKEDCNGKEAIQA
jgi:hypothetical protein